MRYLENRGLDRAAPRARSGRFWATAKWTSPNPWARITLASREKLDNLIFVINCNLQRLDGPVRGNGKMIQELEAAFRGAGWNVIKLIWGGDWDALLARDTDRPAGKAHGRSGGRRIPDLRHAGRRLHPQAFLRQVPRAAGPGLAPQRRRDLSSCGAAGTIRARCITPTRAAVETTGQPTLILAHTIKGYGLGEAGEGRNITHQQKKLNEQEMLHFRSRFEIPIPEEAAHNASFYRPPADSPEMGYLHERRRQLGGYLPTRNAPPRPPGSAAARILQGIAGRLRRPRSLQHHGVRARAHAAA